MAFRTKIGNCELVITEGDITQQDTRAIVNAANSRLAGGGGVDGAIHRAGGPQIMAECRRIGYCAPGQAVITTGGRLRARVIHTVGPIYSGNEQNPKILGDCYRNSLRLAMMHDLRTVAFPSISTGAYGYPVDQAAQVALEAIRGFLEAHPDRFEQVRMVLFDAHTKDAYEKVALAWNAP